MRAFKLALRASSTSLRRTRPRNALPCIPGSRRGGGSWCSCCARCASCEQIEIAAHNAHREFALVQAETAHRVRRVRSAWVRASTSGRSSKTPQQRWQVHESRLIAESFPRKWANRRS